MLKLKILEDTTNNRSLWGISVVCFLWSLSSMMVFSLLPVYLTEVLKVKKISLGFIEGAAIYISYSTRTFSGILSDYIKSRRTVIVIGTIMSTAIKPVFALASTAYTMGMARLVDRLSKGVRAAPTDALLVDLSPHEKRGESFGLRQTFSTLGVICGGVAATLTMILTKNNYQTSFMIATIPAALSLLILWLYVRQPKLDEEHKKEQKNWKIRDIKELPRHFWYMLLVAFVFFLARFSEFFVTLRAKNVGWDPKWLPLVVVFMNIVYSLSAYPAGLIADKRDRKKILFYGMLTLLIANITLGTLSTTWMVLIGILLVGLQLGMSHSLLKAILSEGLPATLRGTGYAVFYLVTSFSLFIGNIVAGSLSDQFGSKAPFWGGQLFTILAMVTLYVIMYLEKKSDKNGKIHSKN